MPKKIHDLVTSTEKSISSTRKSGRYSFAGFRRADEEEKKLAREEKRQIELEKIAREATALRIIEDEEKRITEEQNRIKRNNFVTDKISNAFGTKKTVVIEQEEVNNTLNKAFIPTKNFPEPFEEEPALNRELAEFKKKIHEHIAQLGMAHSSGGGAGFIIDLDDVQTSTAKVDGKFLKYSSSDAKWIGDDPSVTSLAITALDIDGGTDIGAAIVDADLFIIDDGAGGTNRKTAASRLKTYIGAGAADDLSAGDAAVTLTTTSGDITIDAAANNSDIILKGTDGGVDTTFLTIDGSAAGAATFNDKIVATELDISGDVDVDGTMEADAYTVDGTTLAEYISDTVGAMVSSNTETGITVTYQDGDNTIDFVVGTLNQDTTGTASLVTVTNSTANTNFPVTFHDESNALLDDTGALRYNPSTGTLLVPNLSVAGTTTTVDTVTMEAANAVIFEGATADAHETTLSIVDPTGDHTQYLLNQGGYIPLLAAVTTTAITSTPAELNLLDGSSANSVVNSKAVIYGSSGELAGTLSTVAQGNVTSLGTLTTLTVDNIIINGTNIGHTSDADAIAISSAGVVALSATTEASATGTAALTVAGGIGVAKDMWIGDDIVMDSDSAVLKFGADQDVTLTHAADASLTLAGSTAAQLIMSTGSILPSTDTDTSNTGSVTLNFQTKQNFVLTFTGNVTLANPTTETAGQSGVIVCIQDGTGSRTLSLGTDYETAAGAGITLSTAANAVDVIPYFVKAAGSIQLGAVQKAFS